MGEDAADGLSVGEFVEYCRVQTGLLSGKVETLHGELTDLLDGIEADIDDAQARLDDRAADVEGTVAPASPDDPGERAVAEVADLEEDLQERQALVEAKQARLSAFRDLAVAYGELADELAAEVDDGRAAMERVVRFEAENDAPAYFPDRQTVLEAATSSEDSDGDEAASDGSNGE